MNLVIFKFLFLFCFSLIVFSGETKKNNFENWRFQNVDQVIGGERQFVRRYARVIPSVIEYPIVQIYDFKFNSKSFGKNFSHRDISKLLLSFLRIDKWSFQKESERYVYYFKNSDRFNRIISLIIDKKKVDEKIHINYAFSRRGYLEYSLLETISIQNKLIVSDSKALKDPTTYIKKLKRYLLNDAQASDPCDPRTYDADACDEARASSGEYDPSSAFADEIDKITERYERKARKAKKEWDDLDKTKASLAALGGVAAIGFAGRAGSILADSLFRGVPSLVFEGMKELIRKEKKKEALKEIINNIDKYHFNFSDAMAIEEELDEKVKKIIVPMFESAIRLNVELDKIKESYKINEKDMTLACKEKIQKKIETLGSIIDGVEKYLDSICDQVKSHIDDILRMEANLLAFSDFFNKNQRDIKDGLMFRSKTPKLGKRRRAKGAVINNFESVKTEYKYCESKLGEHSKLAAITLKGCYHDSVKLRGREDYPSAQEMKNEWDSCHLVLRKMAGDTKISAKDIDKFPKDLKRYLDKKEPNAKNISDYYLKLRPVRKLLTRAERKELNYPSNYQFDEEIKGSLIDELSNNCMSAGFFDELIVNEKASLVDTQKKTKERIRRGDLNTYWDTLSKANSIILCDTSNGCPIDQSHFKADYIKKLLFGSTTENRGKDSELTTDNGLCENFNEEGSYYKRRVANAIRKSKASDLD